MRHDIEDYLYIPEYSIEYIDSEFPIELLSEEVAYPCDSRMDTDEHIESHTDNPMIVSVVDQVFATVERVLTTATDGHVDPSKVWKVYEIAVRAWLDSNLLSSTTVAAWLQTVPVDDRWLTVSALERFFVSTVLRAVIHCRWNPTYDRKALTDGLTNPRAVMRQVYFGDLGLEV